jgi:hypothetical protein
VCSSGGRRGLFGGGPVARWWVEGRSIQWLGRDLQWVLARPDDGEGVEEGAVGLPKEVTELGHSLFKPLKCFQHWVDVARQQKMMCLCLCFTFQLILISLLLR